MGLKYISGQDFIQCIEYKGNNVSAYKTKDPLEWVEHHTEIGIFDQDALHHHSFRTVYESMLLFCANRDISMADVFIDSYESWYEDQPTTYYAVHYTKRSDEEIEKLKKEKAEKEQKRKDAAKKAAEKRKLKREQKEANTKEKEMKLLKSLAKKHGVKIDAETDTDTNN